MGVRTSIRALSATAAIALCLGSLGACEGDAPPRGVAPYRPPSGTGGEGGELFEPPEECTVPQGACGHQVTKVDFEGPNIYFVLDRSGSMSDPAAMGSPISRYSAVRAAAIEMVKSLGTLINVGAAVFPGSNAACTPGSEVLEISPGDPKSTDGASGPTTQKFEARTQAIPEGGTPISATLLNLVPVLDAAEGETIVFLLTDGGPNCNPGASCAADECQPIVEGACPIGDDCCDPTYPGGGPELCIDRPATVEAVGEIAALGIEVYVIGIPGSEIYEDVLDQMAVAGGTAQAGSPQFHQVTDLSAIGDVFKQLAADKISCELPLGERPSESDTMLTNVFMDCEVLPFDPVNGWTWLEGATVWLHGEACERLKGGGVNEVHIQIGCPTEMPK